jgi:hypothetical protein
MTSYFVVHEIVNFLFTVPAENNLIKIRSTHLLPIFYPFFFSLVARVVDLTILR